MIKQPPSLQEVKRESKWQSRLHSFPLNIEIETDARCNRRCYYCPVAHNKPRKGKMEISFFHKIIKELSVMQYDGFMGFHFYNEPLLDNRLEEFIRIAHENLPHCILYIITNGDYLNQERANSLLGAGLDYIRVSIHDESSEQKSKQLLKNLTQDIAQKVLLYNYYKGERVMTTRAGSIQIDRTKFQVVDVKGGCVWATRMTINYEGKVPLCCDDFYLEHSYGDLKFETLKEIWKKSRKQREKILNGQYEYDICYKCLENSPL